MFTEVDFYARRFKDFHRQQGLLCGSSSPFISTLSRRGLHPIKLAYNHDGRIASSVNSEHL